MPHDHPHAHSPASSFRPGSLLLMGAGTRLGLALTACGLLWLLVWGVV